LSHKGPGRGQTSSRRVKDCLNMWNTDPAKDELCPRGEKPKLDHCTVPPNAARCITPSGEDGSECYCMYRCISKGPVTGGGKTPETPQPTP